MYSGNSGIIVSVADNSLSTMIHGDDVDFFCNSPVRTTAKRLTLGCPILVAACKKYFARGLYWNEPLYFAIESPEDSVNIGVDNNVYLYGNWTVWDSWRLDKLTDGDISIADERAGRDDLNGAATDLLDMYLNEDDEASEELPNGTSMYILDERTLSEEELAAEIEFAKSLLENAIMTSISEGSDVSNIIKNAAFTADGNFQDWETEITFQSSAGSNFSSNTGFTDIYPVAGTWNTAFSVSQYIVADIPDGIYELEAPAFYRPGGNGLGDMEGNDYVPADLFINDYYTPVMNIYKGQVLYEDAINGVNCRYDASGDPEAPHNGEAKTAQDFDTGSGYVPEQRQAVSFAFGGGRYINNVYGVVTGGELRLGIRNTGKPWYESGMTMWGKFKLTYRGYSDEVLIEL